MPGSAAFGLGFLQDLLGFAPLGQGVLVLVLARATGTRARHFLYHRSFGVVWLAFCAFAVCAAVLAYVLQVLLGWRVVPATPGIVQVGLTAGTYPAIAALLTRVHERMQRAEAAA